MSPSNGLPRASHSGNVYTHHHPPTSNPLAQCRLSASLQGRPEEPKGFKNSTGPRKFRRKPVAHPAATPRVFRKISTPVNSSCGYAPARGIHAAPADNQVFRGRFPISPLLPWNARFREVPNLVRSCILNHVSTGT